MICNPWAGARPPLAFAGLGVALLLTSGCAHLSAAAPQAQPEPAAADEILPLSGDVQIADRSEVALDSTDRFYYHVLLGELAAARGDNRAAAEALRDAVRLRADADVAQRGARLALAANAYDIAYELARHWQSSGTAEAQATELLLRLAVETGDLDGALQYGRRFLERYSGPEPAPRALARSLSGAEQGRETAVAVARRLAEAAAAADGADAGLDDAEAAERYYSLSLLALHFDDLETARQATERALALATSAESRDQYSLMQVGVLLQAGDAAAAENAAQQALSRAGDAIALRRDLAALFEQSEALPQAESMLRALLAIRPADDEALLSLGRVLLQQERPEDAMAPLRQVWESGSDQAADAAYLLGRAAEMQDDTGTALDWYERAQAGQDNLRAALRMAQIEADSGRLEEARARLQRVRDNNPLFAPRLIRIESELLYQRHRYGEAADLLRSGVAAYPRDTEMRYAYAVALEQAGDTSAARDQLRYILTLEPEHAAALNALGYSFVVANESLDEAEALLQKALALEPDDPAIIDSVGWLRFRQGRLQEALDLLEQAYAAFPDPEVAAHFGEVLWTLGQRERAREVWEAARAENADHPTLTETLQRLLPEAQ